MGSAFNKEVRHQSAFVLLPYSAVQDKKTEVMKYTFMTDYKL